MSRPHKLENGIHVFDHRSMVNVPRRTGDRLPGHIAVFLITDESDAIKPQMAQHLDCPFLGWMTSTDATADVMTHAEFERRCPGLTATGLLADQSSR